MTKFISTMKKTVSVINFDLLHSRVKPNKPQLLALSNQKADPAGNPMVRVYRDGMSRGPLF